MRRTVLGALQTSRLVAIGLMLILGTAISGIAMLGQPQLASAATCTAQDSAPETNILFCGVDSSSVNNAVNGLKTAFDNNSDGNGHNDIQAVMTNDANFNANMFTTGSWALGTANDATAGGGTTNIVVNGNVVATNLQIGSRCPQPVNCQPLSDYKQLGGGIVTRDASWFFDKDSNGTPIHSVKTLVHFDAKGRADFAMWTPCGNFLLFTPTTPPPTQSVSCVSLSAQQVDNTLQYNFMATAQQQNSSINSYTFDFGDNSTPQVVSVNNNATTATASHTYTQTSSQQQFTATVTVNGNVTSNNCQTMVTIPPTTPPAQQSLACVSLTATPMDSANTQFTFTATAQEQNTTIDHYSFQFGDSSPSQTVSTTATTASVNHTFSAPGTYNVQASVTGPLGTFNGSNCMTSVTVPTPPTPPSLPNTGAGDVIGFFGLTTTLGGLFHHFVIRRKLSLR